MKKIISLVLAISIMMFLIGCGNNASGGSTTVETNKSETNSDVGDDGKIHINYWYAWREKIGESKENLVQQFNEMQDKIVVHAEYQGTYDDLHSNTQAAFAAGNAPEVTENEIASILTFARGGLTQDLTEFVTDDLKLEDFDEGLMNEGYVDGKLYGLPFYRSTPILYKNVIMLKEAGLDPQGPRDWKEFKEYLEVLRDKDNNIYGLINPIAIWFFEAHVASTGGALVVDEKPTLTDPSVIKAAELLKEFYNEDLMKVPVGEQANEIRKQDFASSKAAMIFSSTPDLSYVLNVANENGFELDVSFIPKIEDYAVPTGGCNLVMTSGLSPEKQEAAWEFMKWITDTEQTAYSSEYTGYLPSRYSAMETDRLKNLYETTPQFKVAVDQLDYAVMRPVVEGWAEVEKLLTEQVTTIVTQDKDPAESLEELQGTAEMLLK